MKVNDKIYFPRFMKPIRDKDCDGIIRVVLGSGEKLLFIFVTLGALGMWKGSAAKVNQ
jgi:hypothetical protein